MTYNVNVVGSIHGWRWSIHWICWQLKIGYHFNISIYSKVLKVTSYSKHFHFCHLSFYSQKFVTACHSERHRRMGQMQRLIKFNKTQRLLWEWQHQNTKKTSSIITRKQDFFLSQYCHFVSKLKSTICIDRGKRKLHFLEFAWIL